MNREQGLGGPAEMGQGMGGIKGVEITLQAGPVPCRQDQSCHSCHPQLGYWWWCFPNWDDVVFQRGGD